MPLFAGILSLAVALGAVSPVLAFPGARTPGADARNAAPIPAVISGRLAGRNRRTAYARVAADHSARLRNILALGA